MVNIINLNDNPTDRKVDDDCNADFYVLSATDLMTGAILSAEGKKVGLTLAENRVGAAEKGLCLNAVRVVGLQPDGATEGAQGGEGAVVMGDFAETAAIAAGDDDVLHPFQHGVLHEEALLVGQGRLLFNQIP